MKNILRVEKNRPSLLSISGQTMARGESLDKAGIVYGATTAGDVEVEKHIFFIRDDQRACDNQIPITFVLFWRLDLTTSIL